MDRYHHCPTFENRAWRFKLVRTPIMHLLAAFLTIGWATSIVLADEYHTAMESQTREAKDTQETLEKLEERAEKAALYVYLQLDGGIFVMRETGEAAYVSEMVLRDELHRVKEQGGVLLYSREQPEADPPAFMDTIFQIIVSYGLPIRLVPPHPDDASRPDDYVPPVILAAYHGDTGWLTELIGYGVDLDARDQYRQTALMMAANAGQREAVRMLISAGARVNERDYQNSTPIMFAAQHGYTDIVKMLIAAGADLTVRGTHGLNALDFAKHNNHPDVVALLR